MSHAEDIAQQSSPGKALVPVKSASSQHEWADLRSAVDWLQKRRPVLLTAIVMVVAQVVWRAQFLSRMYYLRQDFFNLDFAIRSPFDWHYLTYVGTGHLTIGERAIIWVLARISLYDWGLASAVTLAFLAGAGLAAFLVLRTLFGERPAILLPLAIYLLSPLNVAGLGWWTVALESVPLQLALFMALNSHIYYVRTGRPRHLAAAAAWVLFGLLAFEKGLVVPLLLFGVTAGFLVGGGSWLSGLRRASARYWRAWLLYAVVLAGYVIVLATSLPTSTTQPQLPRSLASMLAFGWGLLKGSLLPGAIGGPWRWWPTPGGWYALAAPPVAMIWLAFIAAATVVAASILRRRISWRAWVIFAGWVVCADMLPVIVGRLNWYPALLALDTRYVADAVPVLAVCIGLAFLPLTGEAAAGAAPQATAPGSGLTGFRARLNSARSEQAWRYGLVGLLAVFVVGSVGSAQAYQSRTTGQPGASYIANATAATELVPRGTLVLDSAVPDEMRDSTYGTRAVVGVIQPGKLTWVERPNGTVDRLRIFGADGRLYPAWVYGASSRPSPADHGCWPDRGGRISIKFVHRPPYLATVLRIGYIWYAPYPSLVTVRYGSSVRVLGVLPGLHTGYLPEAGGLVSGVVVTDLSGVRMCVGDVEAGGLQPVIGGKPIPSVSQ